jgi:hypothetical protein
MKLLMENWRRYLRENISSITDIVDAVSQMSLEEFLANPPEGYAYNPDVSYMGQHHKSKQGETINLGPSFFKLPVGRRRKGLLYHELGHGLMTNFMKDWKDVFEPFRINRDVEPLSAASRWENDFGFENRVEEVLADAYSLLMQSSELPYESEKYLNLFAQIKNIAPKVGIPIPSVLGGL